MSARELFHRHPTNPILTAGMWPQPVNTAFNPAAAQLDGSTVVVARIEDLTGISHLWVARSDNGVDGWRIDAEPMLSATEGVESELWGFEDARVVYLPELERWSITCTAYGPGGPAVYLATTTDFLTVERHGIIRHPDDKNAALLPERIDGRWVLFHRPRNEFGGSHGEVLLSRSADLESWSSPELVMRPRAGAWWDATRIGIGPPPLLTPHGWLLVYHGVKETVSGDIYRVGLALLDTHEPTILTHRLPQWVLGPLAPYERVGDVPNTVFPCGLVHEQDTGRIRLYYGAADTSICLATAHLDDLLGAVLAHPVARS